MKIKELISKLQEFDPELEVVVSGHEEGYDPVDIVGEVKLMNGKKTEWWCGQYPMAYKQEEVDFIAVVIR